MKLMTDDVREAVRVQMAKRNWRQKDLASDTGVSKQYLSQMLSGKAANTPDAWEKVLSSLGLRLIAVPIDTPDA